METKSNDPKTSFFNGIVTSGVTPYNVASLVGINHE